MPTGLPFVTSAARLRTLPWLVLLAACAAPPGPPTVDESRRRPVNNRADVELQVCTNELQNARLLQAQSERRAQTAAATLANVATRQKVMTAVQAHLRPLDLANKVFSVHFGIGDAGVALPQDVAAALVESARSAPLIVLRGRTDGSADTPAESHIAQARAAAVRDFLVAAGVDPARIRATYQPAGDDMADNTSSEGRRQNRRVEIELYALAPVSIDPAAVAPR